MANADNAGILTEIIPEAHIRDFLIKLIDSLPNIVAILNEDRKLVYTNQSLLDELSLPNFQDAFQMRPGELFSCVNADTGPDGCGSSEACQLCGALRAMQMSKQSGKRTSQDCRILSKTGSGTKSYNFRFTSSSFIVSAAQFFIITIEDISGEQRKRELEKIFFHDVLNSMAGIEGVIGLIKQKVTDPLYLKILEDSYSNLLETINAQKEFSKAETGELEINRRTVESMDLLQKVVLPFKESKAYLARPLISENSISFEIDTDPVLLSRVITNMLKNALEASDEDEIVSAGAEKAEGTYTFWIHNPKHIPRDIQLQIFERSFSTKGSGRGLGTYSMKLLGENYLGGEVNFSSNPDTGTKFWISLKDSKTEN